MTEDKLVAIKFSRAKDDCNHEANECMVYVFFYVVAWARPLLMVGQN